MTYESPFACMANCALGECRNKTTGCRGECQVRSERIGIVQRLRDVADHQAADRIAELERQVAELRKDAERYRFLRDKASAQEVEYWFWMDSVDEMEAAIDAALAQAKMEGSNNG